MFYYGEVVTDAVWRKEAPSSAWDISIWNVKWPLSTSLTWQNGAARRMCALTAPTGDGSWGQWAVKDSCFLPFNCPVNIPGEQWAFERPPPQINKISTVFPARIPPLPFSTAQSAPGKQGVWGAGISIGRSWGAGTGGLRSDTSNLRPVLCPSSCSSSSVTAQCHCAMASETSEAPHAVCVYLVLQQECRAIPRAAVSEAWNGKGKEIAVKLPGIATARVLQSACEKPRQVFRWIQELFAKSMGLMFPRLSC